MVKRRNTKLNAEELTLKGLNPYEIITLYSIMERTVGRYQLALADPMRWHEPNDTHFPLIITSPFLHGVDPGGGGGGHVPFTVTKSDIRLNKLAGWSPTSLLNHCARFIIIIDVVLVNVY